MKKNYINKKMRATLLAAAIILLVSGCTHRPMPVAKHVPGMETAIDSSLAPLLQPVNRLVIASVSTVKALAETRIASTRIQGIVNYDTRNLQVISSRVSGRIEKLELRYNYQPVRKGQLIMEIYSQELAAAQQELLFLARQPYNGGLLQQARQKLKLLGMQEREISRLLQSGKPNYRVPVYSPANGFILEKEIALSATTPLLPNRERNGSPSALLVREGQYVEAGQPLFTVYNDTRLLVEFYLPPSLSAFIKKGQSLILHAAGDSANSYRGSIDHIQPSFAAGSNFTVVRVYLKSDWLLYGQLVTAYIPVIYKGWWLPQSAVISLGDRQLVFKKEKGVFQPQAVTITGSADGMVLVDSAVAGWEVARHAAFLVDSEGLIDVK